MSSSSDAIIHHKDIYGYYLALQDFFRISDIKHDRSNSPRAQKARAKLLKLSASQFYELSTDVYDELQRRLNAQPGQPEYLLPKAGFHIKRNQARQKLANLSQTRFNDLVDDILFEIKRRGYNVSPNGADNFDKSRDEDDQNTYDRSYMDNMNASNGNTISTSDGSVVQVPPTATIQASQVIPKKASIDWSSEEDDDERRDIVPLNKTTEGENVVSGKAVSTNVEIDSPDSSVNRVNPSTPVLKSFADDYHYSELHETPATLRFLDSAKSKRSDQGLFNGIANSKDDEFPRAIGRSSQEQSDVLKEENERLTAELTKKKAEIVRLEEENKKLNAASEVNKDRGSFSTSSNLQEELTSLSSKVSNLSIENEKLKQQISELELKAKHSVAGKANNQVQDMEGSQSGFSLDPQSITKFVTEDGSVPFETVKDIFHQINLLQTRIQLEKDNDGKSLFEVLTHVSGSIHQMLIMVDVAQFKDEVILLKASLSHAVTAVRYHAVYHPMLPKITVQAAISELAFAICSLVDSSKIKPEEPAGEIVKTQGSREADLNDAIVPPHTPIEPVFGPRLSQQGLSNPADVFTAAEDITDEMSPVKPLKITQRANLSPSTTKSKPSSSRKTSGSLLFSSMIETKSPLSSHSSKVHVRPPQVSTDEKSEENPQKPVRFDSGVKDGKKSSSTGKNSEPLGADSAKKGEGSGEGQIQPSRDIGPITPTKSTNNTTINIIDGTPSLPTPVAHGFSNSEKNEQEFPNREVQSNADEVAIKKARPQQAVETSVPSLNRSFTDKLKSFANGTGIGLRVEKDVKHNDKQSEVTAKDTSKQVPMTSSNRSEQPDREPDAERELEGKKSKETPDTPHQSKDGPGDKPEQKDKVDNYTGEKPNPLSRQENTPKRENMAEGQTPAGKDNARNEQVTSTSKSVNYSPLRPPEKNPTPSKLTEKFKKTFDDMSDNDTEDESKSDFNDSSNFSDDGSTYMALRQTLRQSDSTGQDARTVRKATVYSPRAQQNSQFNDSETRFGSDTDLSDIPSDYPREKKDLDGTKQTSLGGNSLKENGSNELLLKKPTSSSFDFNNTRNSPPRVNSFEADLNASPVKQEDLGESPDYQFVPLEKKNVVKEQTNTLKASNKYSEQREEADDDVDFDFDAFDIENPDNTLSELLLYLEHQTIQVISTIQSLLTSIKQPQATKGELRTESGAINQVIKQMVDATSVSMNQSRNASLKEHGSWVVKSLEDCSLRMVTLCELNGERTLADAKKDADFADKHFKQRLAGIAFDVAKCTKELVKTVEEASLKEEIAFLNSRLN